jgi:hypothetical protein
MSPVFISSSSVSSVSFSPEEPGILQRRDMRRMLLSAAEVFSLVQLEVVCAQLNREAEVLLLQPCHCLFPSTLSYLPTL